MNPAVKSDPVPVRLEVAGVRGWRSASATPAGALSGNPEQSR